MGVIVDTAFVSVFTVIEGGVNMQPDWLMIRPAASKGGGGAGSLGASTGGSGGISFQRTCTDEKGVDPALAGRAHAGPGVAIRFQ